MSSGYRDPKPSESGQVRARGAPLSVSKRGQTASKGSGRNCSQLREAEEETGSRGRKGFDATIRNQSSFFSFCLRRKNKIHCLDKDYSSLLSVFAIIQFHYI